MKAIMKLEALTTVEQLPHFLQGTQAVAFSVSSDKDKRYRWLQQELVRFDYPSLKKADKGIVIHYLVKIGCCLTVTALIAAGLALLSAI